MTDKPHKSCPAPMILALCGVWLSPLAAAETPPPLTMAQVLEQSKPTDWRPVRARGN